MRIRLLKNWVKNVGWFFQGLDGGRVLTARAGKQWAILLATVTGLLLPGGAPVFANAATCHSSGPASGTYVVTICIDEPLDGETLTGLRDITASVTVTGDNPGVRRMIFYLAGEYLLTDFEAPYTFELRTHRFVDGVKQLEVEALMRDDFVTERTGIDVIFDNGTTEPPVNTNTFTPSTGRPQVPGEPFIVTAVGDGASGQTTSGQVTDLIERLNPNLLLYLGDVYEKGTPTEFFNWYGTPERFYGRFRDITNPAIGDHEYEDDEAPGYFDYWDNIPHFYSFDLAGWHFVSLDSTNQFKQVTPGTEQYDWLAQDLSSSSATCTIVYYHQPRFSVGPQGDTERLDELWELLAQHNVDMVFNGHDHSYQRWLPLDGAGQPDPDGVTQFVAGTGGHGIQAFVRTDDRLVTGQDSVENAFGVVKLILNQNGANFEFVNIDDEILDSGVIPCSGAGPDTTPPTRPTGLAATTISGTQIDLSWNPARDDTGVLGYTIYRNGVELTTVSGAATSFADVTVMPATTYHYALEAFDSAGNRSQRSDPAVAQTLTEGTFTFTPVADAYVTAESPDVNFGTAPFLRVDMDPDIRSYLRFDVQGLAGTITRATLHILAETGSAVGYDVHRVDDSSWEELTITYQNAPAFDPAVIGSSGPFSSLTETVIDVTSLVTDDGVYNLGLKTTSSTAIRFSSREGNQAPRLVIETVADVTPPPPITETVRDEFNEKSYSNNDGTQSWTTNWIELNDDDKPDKGKVKIDKDQLRLESKERGIQRQANLAGAVSASLQFDYRREKMNKADDYVKLEISSDGGATWTELDRIAGPANDSNLQSISYDITSHISGNTVIRFFTSGKMDGKLRIDNLQIEYVFLVGSDQTETVRDEFETRSYDNNDGTQNWTMAWGEINDDGQPDDGKIKIDKDQLLLKDKERGIQRSADLSGATLAVLSLDFRREKMDKAKHYVAIQVSLDDGETWSELARIAGPVKKEDLQRARFNFTNYIDANATLRFLTSPDMKGELWVDNVEIAYTLGDPHASGS